MFIKLRKKFINWLRISDEYNEEGYRYNIRSLDEDTIKKVSKYNVKVKTRSSTHGMVSKTQSDTDQVNIDSRGITFSVYPGIGGIAVESKTYNTHSDEWETSLHIVPDGAELSDTLAHIITMQALRHK
jgi:hypothetical protein